MSAPSLHPSGWSLRARLLAAVIGLLALVCVVLGVGSSVALDHSLVARLDDQLTAAGGRASDFTGHHPDGDVVTRPGPGLTGGMGVRFLGGPGQRTGTVGAEVRDGVVAAFGRLDDDGTVEGLPTAEAAPLLALRPDQPPQTVHVDGVGDVRAVATTSPDGDVVITGLPLKDVHDTVFWFIGLEAAVSGGALLLTGFAGALIVRRSLRPLQHVATVATKVTALPLAQGEVELADRVPERDTDPRTEVGRVGRALNQLLDHVGTALQARQASETRVRQFVADASHELRTPLAAIRGYAELTRRSRDEVPPDVAHALGRVESEATRMTGLVEDLLLLARLDAGRPLTREPVDLSSLVVDALSDASAAGPEHVWRLDLPDEPVEVLGDRARLHQVVANLLANARTHTPARTTVTASLRTSTPGEVVLTVLDDGPGIPPDLLPHVFERFARGDGSRARQTGSTGLGLAIVSAIVQAHEGAVQVTSRPGQTAFHVRLPAAPVAPERLRESATAPA